MRAFAQQVDLIGAGILQGIIRCSSFIGLGIVRTDSREYFELTEAYRTSNYAFKMADFTAAALQLSKQFTLVRPDRIKVSRRVYLDQLKHRFDAQIGSDYREEMAHIVIGSQFARVASRVYGKTVANRDGRICEIEERAELISTWIKTPGGWMRHRIRIRSFEQNVEWVEQPEAEMVTSSNRTKYTS